MKRLLRNQIIYNILVLLITIVLAAFATGFAILFLQGFNMNVLGSDFGKAVALLFFIVCAIVLLVIGFILWCPNCHRLWAAQIAEHSKVVGTEHLKFTGDYERLIIDGKPIFGNQRYWERDVANSMLLQCPYCSCRWVDRYQTKEKHL